MRKNKIETIFCLLAFFIFASIFSGGCARNNFGKKTEGVISADETYGILKTTHQNYFSAQEYEDELHYSPECDYEIYIPAKYNPEKKHPLLLSFTLGASVWQKPADKYKFILAKANCSKYYILALKEKIIRQYSIDENKIFLTGFSSVAYLSWDLLNDYPNEFAGAILASGGALSQNPKPLAGKRVFITLGENDYPENIQDGKKIKNHLDASGSTAIFQLQPRAGHNYPAHKNEEMIKFLLAP